MNRASPRRIWSTEKNSGLQSRYRRRRELRSGYLEPIGERIQNLSSREAVAAEQKLRLATNNYPRTAAAVTRCTKDAPVVYRSSELIRDLIIDWVERHKTIPTQPNNNWRIRAVAILRTIPTHHPTIALVNGKD